MQSWAAEETRIYRLNRRLIDIVSAKPTVSVPQALGKNKGVLPFLGQSLPKQFSMAIFAAQLSALWGKTSCC